MTRTYLVRLYAAALAMPWIDLQSNKEFEEKLSADAFRLVLYSVAEQLGEARYYWHVFDPVNDLDTEPVCGDLLDDVGDIYKDLKYSLMILGLAKEDCEENALWQLKSDFDAHWSRHCVNVHYLLSISISRSLSRLHHMLTVRPSCASTCGTSLTNSAAKTQFRAQVFIK